MWLSTDTEKIEIPEEILTLFFTEKKESFKPEEIQEMTKKESISDWKSDDIDYFNEWLDSMKYECYESICSKEIAEFLVKEAMNNIAWGGGYPKETWMSFKDNGYEYTICAFGWSSDLEDKNSSINIIGYKEKI